MISRRQDPIVAIATAPGRGAVGIVRVSGTGLQPLAHAICGRALTPRRAHYGAFLGDDGRPLDHGLALYFPAPHSATGEDVLELQAHGGPVVLQLLLARCLGAPEAPAGLRPAEPGEFTERAFLNGKLDLAQAEAVADLIDASTEAAARSASRSLAGESSDRVERLRDDTVQLRMLVEATLDFPEEDIDFLQQADAGGRVRRLAASLDAVLASARQGALLRDGMHVVLAGQPNVGKSSLLNALAGAELAIVTPIAGTTRDPVRQTIQIEGVPVHVIDTAGLREAGDEVERIGIERTWQAIGQADAIVMLHDLTRRGDAACQADDDAILARIGQAGGEVAQRVLHVFNKADAAPAELLPSGAIALSARRGDGLADLRRALLHRAGWQAVPEGAFVARARHLHALRRGAAHLDAAAAHLDAPQPALDLFAEELRLAHDALGEVTGRMSADDLLGEIFSRFCIGK